MNFIQLKNQDSFKIDGVEKITRGSNSCRGNVVG